MQSIELAARGPEILSQTVQPPGRLGAIGGPLPDCIPDGERGVCLGRRSVGSELKASDGFRPSFAPARLLGGSARDFVFQPRNPLLCLADACSQCLAFRPAFHGSGVDLPHMAEER
jgi:hypothetical protein